MQSHSSAQSHSCVTVPYNTVLSEMVVLSLTFRWLIRQSWPLCADCRFTILGLLCFFRGLLSYFLGPFFNCRAPLLSHTCLSSPLYCLSRFLATGYLDWKSAGFPCFRLPSSTTRSSSPFSLSYRLLHCCLSGSTPQICSWHLFCPLCHLPWILPSGSPSTSSRLGCLRPFGFIFISSPDPSHACWNTSSQINLCCGMLRVPLCITIFCSLRLVGYASRIISLWISWFLQHPSPQTICALIAYDTFSLFLWAPKLVLACHHRPQNTSLFL